MVRHLRGPIHEWLFCRWIIQFTSWGAFYFLFFSLLSLHSAPTYTHTNLLLVQIMTENAYCGTWHTARSNVSQNERNNYNNNNKRWTEKNNNKSQRNSSHFWLLENIKSIYRNEQWSEKRMSNNWNYLLRHNMLTHSTASNLGKIGWCCSFFFGSFRLFCFILNLILSSFASFFLLML